MRQARLAVTNYRDARCHCLRDRALIGRTVYSLACIGAALGLAVGNVYTQSRRLWVWLCDKGLTRHAMPRHCNLEEYLTAHVDGGGLRGDPKGRCSARSGAAPRGSRAQCYPRRTPLQ